MQNDIFSSTYNLLGLVYYPDNNSITIRKSTKVSKPINISIFSGQREDLYLKWFIGGGLKKYALITEDEGNGIDDSTFFDFGIELGTGIINNISLAALFGLYYELYYNYRNSIYMHWIGVDEPVEGFSILFGGRLKYNFNNNFNNIFFDLFTSNSLFNVTFGAGIGIGKVNLTIYLSEFFGSYPGFIINFGMPIF